MERRLKDAINVSPADFGGQIRSTALAERKSEEKERADANN